MNRQPAARSGPQHTSRPATFSITLTVNGQKRTVEVAPWTTLLDLLRDRLDLTGTKKGCDHGQCGACTVHVNGRRVNSCLSLALMHDGEEITTIEGLGTPDEPGPLQRAFVEEQAAQCGYCIAGMVMRAQALLARTRTFSEQELREHMQPNLCRCGTHIRIRRAVRRAAATMRAAEVVPLRKEAAQ